MGDIYHAGSTYAGSLPIDDTRATATNTWSAQKINNEIDTKASKSIITSNDVFDPTKAYVAGDWLIHNNILYEVLVACTGVTPPNATYYKVKTVHDLQSEISALNSELGALKNRNRTLGPVTRGLSSNTSVATKFVAPSDGVILHNSWGNDSYATVTFLKSDNGTATVMNFPPLSMNMVYIPKGTSLYMTAHGNNFSLLYGAYFNY